MNRYEVYLIKCMSLSLDSLSVKPRYHMSFLISRNMS
jgi:hypothetical protein